MEHYPEIWYLGLDSRKIHGEEGAPQNGGYDDENGSYHKVSVIFLLRSPTHPTSSSSSKLQLSAAGNERKKEKKALMSHEFRLSVSLSKRRSCIQSYELFIFV